MTPQPKGTSMNDYPDDEYKLTFQDAMALLPDKPAIHCIRNPVENVLVGADWSRAEVVAAIRRHGAERTGKAATSSGHGMAFRDEHGYVFVETRELAQWPASVKDEKRP